MISSDNLIERQSEKLPKGEEEPALAQPKPGGWRRPVLLLALIVALLVLVQVFGLGGKLGALRDWLQGLGPLGPLVFFVIYIIAVLATVPNGALSIAAGVLFGSAVGIVLVSLAATVGAAAAFLISRYFLLESTVNWLGNNPHYQRLDRLMEEHGAFIVALTRLIPIFPSNFLSYGFGLTKISLFTFVFWTWLCRLPIIVVYVVGADATTQALTQGEVPWFLIVPFLTAVLLLVPFVRFARHRLGTSWGLASRRRQE